MTAAAIENVHDDEEPAPINPWAWPLAVYTCLSVTLILVLHPTAFTLAKSWITSSAYIHGIAVAPITIWMIRRTARPQIIEDTFVPGLMIMTVAAVLWLLGRAATTSLVEHIAFVSLLIGGVGVIFGTKALRAWAYPLTFLYFMIPFGEALIPHLQSITAHLTVSFLMLVGADVLLNGSLIYTHAGVFQVAEACSGLNFLISAMMIAAIFSYFNFQSWKKRLSFLLFAAAVAIVANGIRVFLIILVASFTNDKLALGPDHMLVGWLFYALIFFVLISVGVKYTDAPQTNEPVSKESPQSEARNYTGAKVAFLLLILTASYGGFIIERPVERTAPSSLTLFSAPGWRILPPPDNWRASLPRADRTAAATYTTQSSTVYTAMGYFTHNRRDAEIVTYSNRAWDGDEWRKIGSINEVIYLFGHSKNADFSILAGPERRRLAVVTTYWFDGDIYFKPWRLKLAQMKAKLHGQNPAGGVIMIAASYSQNPAEAVQIIREFTTDVESLNTWLTRNNAL